MITLIIIVSRKHLLLSEMLVTFEISVWHCVLLVLWLFNLHFVLIYLFGPVWLSVSVKVMFSFLWCGWKNEPLDSLEAGSLLICVLLLVPLQTSLFDGSLLLWFLCCGHFEVLVGFKVGDKNVSFSSELGPIYAYSEDEGPILHVHIIHIFIVVESIQIPL